MRRFITAAVVSLLPVALCGCELGSGMATAVEGGIIDLSGGVIGNVTGSFSAVAEPPCSGSTMISFSATLTDLNGSVTETECITSGSGATAFGQYTITGGTGAYQGATGSGTTILSFSNPQIRSFPFTLVEFGTFTVPGAASAASANTKRTFKLRGTIRSVTVRCNHHKRCTIRHPDRVLAHLLRRHKRLYGNQAEVRHRVVPDMRVPTIPSGVSSSRPLQTTTH